MWHPAEGKVGVEVTQESHWATLITRIGGAWGEAVGKVTQVEENDRPCRVKANTGGGLIRGR